MKKYLICGIALIAFTNIFILGGVFYNRSGEPTAQLVLSEREARLTSVRGFKKENSGVGLSISWRVLGNDKGEISYFNRRINLTKQQLRALGFAEREASEDGWEQERTLFFALEYNGELYQKSLANAQSYYEKALARFELDTNDEQLKHAKRRAYDVYQRELHRGSRLFFLEAAQDYKTLATKYAAQSNIVIVKGNAEPVFGYYNNGLSLHLSSLLVNRIHVPAHFVETLTSLKTFRRQIEPSYSVTVNWGKRLEPWIEDIQMN
ncbi:DUF4824 family protein [Pseudoalteromonas spongiae]|uniref:DUF4824 family protein n=1 Tax=Pseudoalteromonas spongiae TaxID=298657 RepID=UPI00110AB206|nr:DUF4824 family protein [Pseudoalteromonas spongiae]TMO83887.1 hypothetical protein CWC15_13110 [Pseudoalteromonas spongiae]